MQNHKNLMEDLIKTHEVLLPLLRNKDLHYIDIPLHNNIGDLLIMQGTLEFFRKNHLKITVMASAYDYAYPKLSKDTVIVLHGGGNLGDLYRLHQEFREKVIQAYPNNRIVILPQTIYFESQQNFEESASCFQEHKDLHLCVRDKESYSLAKNMSKNVYLLPDMAHQLYPIKSINKPIKNRIKIERIDIESSSIGDMYECDDATDWNILLGHKRIFVTRFLSKGLRVASSLRFEVLRRGVMWCWLKYTNYLSLQAINLFSTYESVVANRLHAHILAMLMDKPNTIIDNSYGKNRGYIECWTNDSELVTLVDTD